MSFVPSQKLLDKFRKLGGERLERTLSSLEQLQQMSPEQLQSEAAEKLLGAVKRELHTLKGDASMLGFRGVADVTLALERLLKRPAEELMMESFYSSEVKTAAHHIRALLAAAPGPAGADADAFVEHAANIQPSPLVQPNDHPAGTSAGSPTGPRPINHGELDSSPHQRS